MFVKLSKSFSAPKVNSRPQISFLQNPYSRFNLNNTNLFQTERNYPRIPVKFPPSGDSVTEGRLQKWHFKIGDYVEEDQSVVSIETDKLVTEVNAPQGGVLLEQLHPEGTTVFVDKDLFVLDTDAKPTAKAEEPKAAATKAAEPKAAEKVAQVEPQKAAPKVDAPKPAQPQATPTPGRERRVKMSVLRERISQRLKESQNTAAMLTTFQECDMSKLMEMRNEFKDAFFEKHKVKLGFMSAFVKASAAALTDMPIVNAVIDGGDIVYRDYVDISVAVATPTGLVTPVLRDCDKLSFADVEKEIVSLGERARGINGRLTMADLTGGTFTISNGGVYGSLMGTPIINPPQSAILGMHGIVERPVVVNGQIVIRPIMYLALTYDHRLIDGREAVTFLRKIKFGVEDPRRLLLDI